MNRHHIRGCVGCLCALCRENERLNAQRVVDAVPTNALAETQVPLQEILSDGHYRAALSYTVGEDWNDD